MRNWPDDARGLVRRGDIRVWVSEDAIDGWRAACRTMPGGQRRFSNLAIETTLTLGAVPGLPLRQAKGFLRSLMEMMKLGLAVPDHTTPARRRRTVDVHDDRWRRKGPIDIVIDSTGLKIFNARPGRLPPKIVIPPGKSSIPDKGEPLGGSERERHAAQIAVRGRMAWQRRHGYGKRSPVETAISRIKRINGGRLTSRTFGARRNEVAIRIKVANRTMTLARPVSERVRQPSDKAGAAPKCLGAPKPYGAARAQILPNVEHRSHKGLNNRAENAHVPLRKRERIMQHFRSAGALQRFVSIFSAVRNLIVPTRSKRSALGIHNHRLQATAESHSVTAAA